MGITVHPPTGCAVHRLHRGVLLVEIGRLVVIGGAIHVVPKIGITAPQHTQLIGAAESAFFATYSERLGWLRGEGRWTSWISVPAQTTPVTALADSMSAHLDQTTQ